MIPGQRFAKFGSILYQYCLMTIRSSSSNSVAMNFALQITQTRNFRNCLFQTKLFDNVYFISSPRLTQLISSALRQTDQQ